MVHIFRSCLRQNSRRSGTRAIVPSSLQISQITAAGFRPANRAKSTLPSVCPARTKTPPSRALKPGTCPLPRTKSDGLLRSSIATWTVLARSAAEMPVVMPNRASIQGVKGVVCVSAGEAGTKSRPNRSQIAPSMAKQTNPQAWRIMKLMVSGLAISAAKTRSPSFSRLGSSTKTISLPARNSSRASSTLQNPSGKISPGIRNSSCNASQPVPTFCRINRALS